MSDKKRHTIWIDDDIWQELLCIYKRDNCSTQNEFVENALRFYIGYLNTKNAGAFLPEVLSDMLQGTLDHYAQRIGSVQTGRGHQCTEPDHRIRYRYRRRRVPAAAGQSHS